MTLPVWNSLAHLPAASCQTVITPMNQARHILERCNAFERPADTVKLMMPSS